MGETQYAPVSGLVLDGSVPPIRSSQPGVDIPGFFDIVEKVMSLYIQTEAAPDNTTPTLVHEFPKERLAKPDTKFDIITYKVLESTMAPTSNDGAKPRGPKLRETKQHPNLAGFNVQEYGWWELVQAEFSIWSKSSRNADLVTAWFHRFMMKYAFAYRFFLSRGVSNFRFVKRMDDDIDHSFGQEVYRRRLIYEFRLETLYAVEQKQLTDVDVNYGISGPTDSFEIKSTL